MASDVFPVGTNHPDPRPKDAPGPIAPDPAADGVTWYTLQDGSMIPGEGTYVDIVAQNIEEIIICANNIDSIIQAVDANVQAQDAANRAAASATAAANSATAANGSASLASASASAAQTSAVNAASSATAAGTSATNAATSATNAANSATASANSATSSANSAASAAASYNTFHNTWYGPYPSPPALDPAGLNPTQGDLYFDTTLQAVQVYNGTSWQAIASGVISVAGKSGAVTLFHNDISDWNASLAPYATLASPAFTGTPTAPTVTPSTDNTTKIATTAFVRSALGGVQGGAIVAATPPAFVAGSIWFDSTGGQTYIAYDDGNSQQYVPATNAVPLNSATKADVATALTNVGRNLVHNPLFNIAQRGAGPFSTSNSYTLDRWTINAAADVFSVTQATLNDTARTQIGDEQANFVLQNTFTGNAGATSSHNLMQRIENVRRLAGKTVTLSFWAIGNGVLKLGINFLQSFGTGGSPSAALWIAPGQAVTPLAAWSRFSVIAAIPSISGKTLGTNGDDYTGAAFFFSAGANANSSAGNIGVQSGTVQLWGVQLEVSPVATILEKPDPADDLRKCQRFYCISASFINAVGAAGQAIGVQAYFPVSMRATPSTVTFFSTSLTNCSALSSVQPTSVGTLVMATVTAAATAQINTGITASADL